MFNRTDLCAVVLATAAAVALATPACATAISPTTRPASAAQVAAARAEGDALLKAAHAETLFDNETGAASRGAIVLRHRRSGVRCVLVPGRTSNKVRVYASPVRGDDVGCRTSGAADVRNIYIYRAPEKAIAELLSDAEVELRPIAADAYRPANPPADRPFTPPAGPPLPDHVTSTLVSGDVAYVIVLGKLGDWAVEHRFSGPLSLTGQVTDVRDIWADTIADARNHPPTPQSAADAAASPQSPRKLSEADARAQADALIAAGDASEKFANASARGDIAVRHKASNFTCRFPPDEPDSEIRVLKAEPTSEDVSCTARQGDAVYSYYVTRVGGRLTLEEATNSYDAEIRRFHPDAKPAAGAWANASAKKNGVEVAPPHLSRRFNYSANGQPMFSRLSVAVVGDWVVEQRVTAPVANAAARDLAAELEMMTSLIAMAQQSL